MTAPKLSRFQREQQRREEKGELLPPLPRGALAGQSNAMVVRTVLNHKAMVQLAREHTTDCILYLVRALHMPSAGVMARLKAAELLLAYGWGKPPQAIAISTDQHVPGQGLAALSIAERVRAVTESSLGIKRAPIDLKTSDVRMAGPAGTEFV